jgi:hypothetical protein
MVRRSNTIKKLNFTGWNGLFVSSVVFSANPLLQSMTEWLIFREVSYFLHGLHLSCDSPALSKQRQWIILRRCHPRISVERGRNDETDGCWVVRRQGPHSSGSFL